MSDSSAATASPELPACFAPGDQGLLGLRLGGLFGILVVSTFGVFIPFFTYKAKLTSVYFLLRAFAAGVVLTTGYASRRTQVWPLDSQGLLCYCSLCVQVRTCSWGRVSNSD